MKEIKQCPLKKEKCSYRVSRMNTTSGCSLYENVNLCAKCTKHREKQSKHTIEACLLYTSPSPRDLSTSRMPSSA